MTKLILSTGNVMSAGPSIIRRGGGTTRSNLELVNALRDSFSAARQDYGIDEALANGRPPSGPSPSQVSPEAWTERDTDDDTLYIPRINWETASHLREEPSEYETTVKLFLLPATSVPERRAYAREALALVGKELGITSVDLLIVSFPGISFEGGSGCDVEADRTNAQQGNLDDEVATWTIFEELHREGVAKQLGIAEFGSDKLRAFLDRTAIHPTIDQINLQDCCSVPRALKELADEAGIKLNVHSDCTDVLPHGTLRELLGHGPQGAGILEDPAHGGAGLEGEITPHWVVRYTAFVRNRGVIENKGYFAGAELK